MTLFASPGVVVVCVGLGIFVFFWLRDSRDLFWWWREVKVAWSGYRLALASHSAKHQERIKKDEIKTYLPKSLDDSRAFDAFQLTPSLQLKNRIIRAAAFGGSTVEELVQCHSEVARGGAAMTTIAYACVSPDGLTFKEQLMLHETSDPSIRRTLKRVVDAVHEAGAKISIQLTHGGGFADPALAPSGRTVAPSCVFNPAAMNFPEEMRQDDFVRLENDFVEAACLCQSCGFDCLELHCGHGYLLSQFLSPFTNRRCDMFGGIHRKRFPVQILRRIRAAVGHDFPIIVKMNVHDGFDGGVNLADVRANAKAFEEAGASMLVPSGGFVSRNGLYMLRGAVPLIPMARAMFRSSILKSIATLVFGPFFVPSTNFEEAFFRNEARVVKATVNNIPVALVGGVISLGLIEGALREGFACVQMARAIIRNPDIVNEMRHSLGGGENVTSACTRCNLCVVATLNPMLPMHCVLRPRKIECDLNGRDIF